MSILNNFEKKDFIEQVSILGDISGQKQYEHLDQIMNLFETMSPNDAIGYMVKNTLRTLLAGKEESAIKGLSSDNIDLKKMCIELVGEQKSISALPILVKLIDHEKDHEILFAILSALSKIKPQESLTIFQKFINHKDSLVSSLSIEMVGSLNDVSSIEQLCEIITKAESETNYEKCSIPTVNAIKALGQLKNDSVISFLVSKIHHKNPTVRSLIQQELIQMGQVAIPFITPVFEQDDVDKKIMSANLLGCLGIKEAGDILVNALDKGWANHPNIKFAIYEALGKIPSMTSIVCLTDGLAEKDDLILFAVVSSLDKNINQWIIDKIRDLICTDDPHGESLIKAIISSSALNIFEKLYCMDDNLAQKLINGISKSNDEKIISVFCEKLEQIEVDRAKSDIQLLKKSATSKTQIKLLAIDDSEAMLHFYRNVASEMGLVITTALNGKEAVDILENGDTFNVIITDMNMPVMDGIEFTRQARRYQDMTEIPIIMITTESQKTQEQLAIKAGVNDFINKPFTPEQLQEKIKKFI